MRTLVREKSFLFNAPSSFLESRMNQEQKGASGGTSQAIVTKNQSDPVAGRSTDLKTVQGNSKEQVVPQKVVDLITKKVNQKFRKEFRRASAHRKKMRSQMEKYDTQMDKLIALHGALGGVMVNTAVKIDQNVKSIGQMKIDFKKDISDGE